jgi:large subunit ribosomal protein L32
MPVPKFRKSRSNTHSRRANWKTEATGLSLCPKCSAHKLPHTACSTCGEYKGRTYDNAVRSDLVEN